MPTCRRGPRGHPELVLTPHTLQLLSPETENAHYAPSPTGTRLLGMWGTPPRCPGKQGAPLRMGLATMPSWAQSLRQLRVLLEVISGFSFHVPSAHLSMCSRVPERLSSLSTQEVPSKLFMKRTFWVPSTPPTPFASGLCHVVCQDA